MPPAHPVGPCAHGEGGGEGSDRALKCDIDPVLWPPDPDAGTEATGNDPTTDGYAVLRAVAALPVSTWSYRGEEGVRHLGPMAQDWYAALGLGADDRTIHGEPARQAARRPMTPGPRASRRSRHRRRAALPSSARYSAWISRPLCVRPRTC
ncbi:tail fiber domain-containing protein [Streptomyces afghaniensis]|uniref:tail fiber domain-containing protein n=1 Tax=Streptomyces afghaniensis TaxID=66865 RepID=UPI0033A0A1D2